MTIISYYKRRCDYCGKTADVQNCISIVKGKKHSCKKCAGKKIREMEVPK